MLTILGICKNPFDSSSSVYPAYHLIHQHIKTAGNWQQGKPHNAFDPFPDEGLPAQHAVSATKRRDKSRSLSPAEWASNRISAICLRFAFSHQDLAETPRNSGIKARQK